MCVAYFEEEEVGRRIKVFNSAEGDGSPQAALNETHRGKSKQFKTDVLNHRHHRIDSFRRCSLDDSFDLMNVGRQPTRLTVSDLIIIIV